MTDLSLIVAAVGLGCILISHELRDIARELHDIKIILKEQGEV